MNIHRLHHFYVSKLALVLALALFSGTASLLATTYPPTSSFPGGTYSDALGLLPYRYFVPINYNASDTSTKYPLVIFLHGDGEKGTDNSAQLGNNANGSMIFVASASPNNQVAYPCFYIAPQTYYNRYPSQIEGIITYFLAHYNIDPDRIYLTGLSGGAAFVYNTLATYPNRYAAAAACAGWGTGPSTDINFKNIPLWAFHCADDGTVPVGGSDGVVSNLRAVGGDPIYTRYATGGHGGSWSGAYNAGTPLVPWMMAQRRGKPNNLSTVELLSITSPTVTNAAAILSSSTAAVSGTTGDATSGVTSVTWTSLRTSSTGTASGTTNWSVSSISLSSGSNLVRFLATGVSYPTAGNGSTSYSFTPNFYYSTSADTTPPVVTISSPTNASTYQTPLRTLTLSGTASDNFAVNRVIWTNSRGGTGVTVGTTSWTITAMDLQLGVNTITVSAYDAANNSSSAVIAVTCDPTIGNQAPIVNAGTSQTTTLPSPVTLAGIASDDGLPLNSVFTTTWSKVSGPGTVTFGNVNVTTTSAAFSAAGSYVLQLLGTDTIATSTSTVTIIVNSLPSGTQRILVNFGATTIGSNWNNLNGSAVGTAVNNCIDMTGASTGIKLAVSQAFTSYNSAGNTTSAPVINGVTYPTTATGDSYYTDAGKTATLHLTGLSPSGYYNFTFYASRMAAGAARPVLYTIGNRSTILDANDNTSKITTLTAVSPDSTGALDISLTGNSGSYGYLGILDIAKLPAGATLSSAVSRMTHGSYGTFDIPLPVTGTVAGIECRSSAATPGSYNIVCTFSKAISAADVTVTSGIAVVGSTTFSGTTLSIPLTNVANAQNVTLNYTVQSADGSAPTTGNLTIGFLKGDIDGNKIVNSLDVLPLKTGYSYNGGQAQFNPRADLNCDGVVTTPDITIIQQSAYTTLP